MAERVEPTHTRGSQRDDADRRDADIGQPQRLRGLGDARRELLVLDRARGLGPVERHAADPEQRQHGDRQHDDADAAEPVQRMPPKIDGGRQIVEPGDHGRAGGGEPGDGLEIGVREADPGQRDHQRNGGRQRHQHPGERHQQKSVAGLELAFIAACGASDREAYHHVDARGDREIVEGPVLEHERAHERQDESDGEQRHQHSEHMGDGEHGERC